MGNDPSMSYDGSYSSGGNDTSFAATFAREHARQGAGHTFDWNGKLYTTDRADGRDLRAERMARDNSTSSSMHSSFGGSSGYNVSSHSNWSSNSRSNSHSHFNSLPWEARGFGSFGGLDNSYARTSNSTSNSTSTSNRYVRPTTIGSNGLELIKRSEGKRLTCYLPTPNDKATIGYGNTNSVTKKDIGRKTITEYEAERLLKNDVKGAERVVTRSVNAEINQNQFDALVSFVYNVGAGHFRNSTLLKKLNKNDFDGASDEFLRWNKQAGKVLNGLTKRRKAEKKLFDK